MNRLKHSNQGSASSWATVAAVAVMPAGLGGWRRSRNGAGAQNFGARCSNAACSVATSAAASEHFEKRTRSSAASMKTYEGCRSGSWGWQGQKRSWSEISTKSNRKQMKRRQRWKRDYVRRPYLSVTLWCLSFEPTGRTLLKPVGKWEVRLWQPLLGPKETWNIVHTLWRMSIRIGYSLKGHCFCKALPAWTGPPRVLSALIVLPQRLTRLAQKS